MFACIVMRNVGGWFISFCYSYKEGYEEGNKEGNSEVIMKVIDMS